MFGIRTSKTSANLKVSNRSAFTLLEIVVVLAIVALLAGTLIPLSFQFMDARREKATRQEIETIFEGIFGNPEKGSFGYVGDIGALPGSLDDLLTKPGGVSDFAHHTNDVGYGWRGPYIDTVYSDIKDGWGNAYDLGVVKTGQIRSAGPGGDFSTTDDNIVFPFVDAASGAVETDGTLLVTAFVNDIPNPSGTTVTVYFATNGTEDVTPLSDSTPSDGFKFSTHQGIHAVKVTHVSSDTNPITTTKTVNVPVVGRRQVSEEIFLRTTGIVSP
ncbi:MAG: prepilin-type N-terminal cleavage/methylation domain-containing protein [Candidatus Brocadiales bacterium]|nr:prepilin-type N-terminal cleavage/methylation domain-containing protein [Candidatus Bathyanammoxibius sp.]